ncbi:PTS sugar transporter subunit IIA [Clostridioides difficile]|uniref:PTS sugar transporter subunit IIA n=4 Tax=Clostridioides difficile TaxID=1496 RepID=UPI001033A1A2
MQIDMNKLTPMMKQYLEVKNRYKDCILFFRLGDFYEMFFEDALVASKALEIALTGKACGLEERAPMCGVPFHSANSYISKLVENGYVKEEYIPAMLEREKVMTTYMGMGVAIPHGVNEAKKEILSSGIVILQFPNGIDFDGEKAYLLIGIAGVGDEHLEILSNIAVVLDDDLTERLKNSNDKQAFMEAFAN